MDFLPFDTLGGLAAVILGFGFIIFVHELGHFLVAKYVGIKCPQFAIGMGNAIFSFRKGIGYRRGSTEGEYDRLIEEYLKREAHVETVPGSAGPDSATTKPTFTVEQRDRAAAALGLGETEYRLNWLPLGGYVKMLGQEDSDPGARSEDPRSFTSKSIGARAAVISAGVVMNIIFGIMFFMIAFLIGVGFNAPTAGTVSPLGPAAEPFALGHEGDLNYLGVRTGDRILTFNGEPIGDMTEVRINTALAPAEEKIKLGVERKTNGKSEQLTYEIIPRKIPAGLLDLGINIPVIPALPADANAENIRKEFVQSGVAPEEAAKIRPGMRIIEAGGVKVESFGDYEAAVRAGQGKPVAVVWESVPSKKDTLPIERVTTHLTANANLMLKKIDEENLVRHLVGLVPAVTIKGVQPESPAAVAGIASGDVIAQIGETKWPTTAGVFKEVSESKSSTVKVIVLRAGSEMSFDIKPRDGRLGIEMISTQPIISRPLPDSPAAKLNLPPGTRITAINGTPVSTFTEMQQVLSAAAKLDRDGFEAVVVCEPNEGKKIEPLTVKLPIDAGSAKALANVGWETPLTPILFMVEMVTLKGDGPVQAIGLGIKKAHQSMLQVYITILRVAQGSVHPRNFQGPVGIAHTGTKIVKQGFAYLIFFLGLISINLAVVNFLPIPIVDGGHIILLIIEKIKGSPVGPRVQTAVLTVGLAMIACMFLYVTYNDIVRLAGEIF